MVDNTSTVICKELDKTAAYSIFYLLNAIAMAMTNVYKHVAFE